MHIQKFKYLDPESQPGCVPQGTEYRTVRITCNHSDAMSAVDFCGCQVNGMLTAKDAVRMFRTKAETLTKQLSQHGCTDLYSYHFPSDTEAYIMLSGTSIARMLLFPLKSFRTPDGEHVFRYRNITIVTAKFNLEAVQTPVRRFFAVTDDNTIYTIGSSLAECLFLVDCKRLTEEQQSRNCYSDTISVETPHGTLTAAVCSDEDDEYPGICVELLTDSDHGQNPSRPKVCVECPKLDEPRVLIWQDPSDEDCTEEIPLTRKALPFEQSYIDLLYKLQTDIQSDIMPSDAKADILAELNKLQTMLERYSG